ncbi:MAG: hypothetical protein HY556_04925 [Euryarchaeota archaeon]|nr:hypothetical protein [Euryarchaeota archaeon]
MAFAVFEIGKPDIDKLKAVLADDTVSRQSIVEREAKAMGFTEDTTLVLIEGSDAGIKHAEELILKFGRKHPKADEIRQKIKDEEDDAATGVGFIFG